MYKFSWKFNRVSELTTQTLGKEMPIIGLEFDKKKNSHLFPKLHTNSLKPKDFSIRYPAIKLVLPLF